MPKKISLFWFRRDLRLDDNVGLYYALKDEHPVLPLFIFDANIIDILEDRDDARINFLHDTLAKMKRELESKGSSLLVKYGKPVEIYRELLNTYDVAAVYTNRDYEPYARERDEAITGILKEKSIPFYTFKDHVVFEKDEILTGSGDFYKVFTPYKRQWMKKFEDHAMESFSPGLQFENWFKTGSLDMPTLSDIGFKPGSVPIPSDDIPEQIIKHYDETRNFPALKNGTSRLGMHLRHGTLSIRKLARKAQELNGSYLNELTWRDFYSQVLWHNPHVVNGAFKPQYDKIPWRDDEESFQRWCEGQTGYPIVDAGMRQLNKIGYMHNRVRMITASFLTKHLLIDWRLGEAYFARKLLDFELASNNGGWQWAAGSGTDAQPYFRVFNPYSQTEKFDKNLDYVKEWVPEYNSSEYIRPIVEHKPARERALETFKTALNG